MPKPTTCEVAAIVRVYLYAGVSAASAPSMSGVRDWKAIGFAALSAVLAPLSQVLNPKDPSAGIKSKRP